MMTEVKKDVNPSLTEPFNAEAHWEDVRFMINAVGVLWQYAGIQLELRGEDSGALGT